MYLSPNLSFNDAIRVGNQFSNAHRTVALKNIAERLFVELCEQSSSMLRARRTTREEEEGDDKSNEKKSRRLEIAETLQDKDLVRNSALGEL